MDGTPSYMHALVHDGESDADRFLDELDSAFASRFRDFLLDCEAEALDWSGVSALFQPSESVEQSFIAWLLQRKLERRPGR